MGASYKYIGKVAPRRDAHDIVAGTVRYTDDLKFQNLLYGKVLRSPYAHALIKRIDKSKAEKLPGVKAVLTYEDIPDWRGGTPRTVRILDKKLRYMGDAVALVAAQTAEIAEEALEFIDVKYEVLPAVFDMDTALKPGAPLVWDEFPGNIIPGGTILYGPNCLKGVAMGDVEKGFAEADVVAEGTFGYENIPNALPPETVGAVALWEEPNRVTIWGTSQAPYMDKMTLFHFFNREVEIRCIGFSRRRRLRNEDYVLAGSELCGSFEQGHGAAGEGHVYKGGTHGGLYPEDRLPYQRQGGHEEGWNTDGHKGHMVCGHRILLLVDPGPGGNRLG